MIAVVVQARTGSSRLPGKVLEDLAGRSVLAHVLARAGAIAGVDVVCCATPETAENDAVEAEAERCGARVHRGPEHDVLARYLGAAEACGADVVMRVTSDCPFLDPEVSGRVLADFRAGGWDYVSNAEPRTWPRGLDTEAFSMDALARAAAEVDAPYDREHVTPYMRREASFRRANTAHAGEDLSAWRWTLDYPEDLAFCRAVMARTESAMPRFSEIRAIVERWPEIARLNAHLETA